MADEYGKIYKRIWGDPDFKALDGAAQLMYLKLLSQPDISLAGVLTLATDRWAKHHKCCSVECAEIRNKKRREMRATKKFPGTCLICGAGTTRKEYKRCNPCKLAGKKVSMPETPEVRND